MTLVLDLVWVVLALVLVRDLVVRAVRRHRCDQTETLAKLGELVKRDVPAAAGGDGRAAAGAGAYQPSGDVRIIPAPPRPRLVKSEAGEPDDSRRGDQPHAA